MEKSNAYIECKSGASGDMLVGAFIDAGVPVDAISDGLKFLPEDDFSLGVKIVTRSNIRATKFDIFVNTTNRPAKTWSDVHSLISSANTLSMSVKDLSLKMFRSIFEAEAQVHNVEFDHTHLHELSAIDCIVDIVGVAICVDYLGLKNISASPVNLGGGTVKTSHGLLPVPAPATALLLHGFPVYFSNFSMELTTPTGACILKNIVTNHSKAPEMLIKNIGYGAGSKDFQEMPNVLRVFLGDDFNCGPNNITIIETNIDDMTPQLYEPLMEALFAHGALDVFFTPVVMKKSRPAVKLTVLVENFDIKKMCDVIFRNSSTIGLRYYEVQRETLSREIKTISTVFGNVKVKVAYKNYGEILNASPEYDDCKRLADKHGVTVKAVMAAALSHCK